MASFSDQSLFVLAQYRKLALENNFNLLFNTNTNGLLKTTSEFVDIIDKCSIPRTYKELVESIQETHGSTDLNQFNDTLTNAINSGILLHLNHDYTYDTPASIGSLSEIEASQSTCTPDPSLQHVNKVCIMITDRCNLDCIYCLNKSSRREQRSELSFSQWRMIIDQMKDIGCTNVTISGGEPLLASTTFDVAAYCRSNDMSTAVITNGTLVSENNISLMTDCFDDISISIDSHIPSIADRLRGEGTYISANAAISLLEKKKVGCTLNAVMTGINIDHLPAMYEYYHSQYSNILDVNTMIQEYDSLCPEIAISTEQVLQFVSNRFNYYIDKYGYDVLNKREAFNLSPRSGCGVGRNEIAVSPDGKVFPCRILYTKELECGDLLNNSLIDVLNNSKVLAKIQHADINRPEKCENGDCGFVTFCRGGCFASAYYASRRYVPVISPRQCAFQHKHIAAQLALKVSSKLAT
jgi:radical SAM protein with 4Fe4S-binding SPASM domain